MQNQAWEFRKKGLEVLLVPPLFVPFDMLVPAMKVRILSFVLGIFLFGVLGVSGGYSGDVLESEEVEKG